MLLAARYYVIVQEASKIGPGRPNSLFVEYLHESGDNIFSKNVIALVTVPGERPTLLVNDQPSPSLVIDQPSALENARGCQPSALENARG